MPQLPVTSKLEQGILTITLNRPEKRNAMNGEMIKTWIALLDDALKNETIRLLMICGEGDHFCSGADIDWMKHMAARSLKENEEDAFQLAQLLNKIAMFPKPVITLLQGAVMGGALGIVAASDVVIAEENAFFSFSEAKIGLVPSVISPYVVSLLGDRMARYYFLTASRFNAMEAFRIQLVHQVVSKESLVSSGMKIAESILQNSPKALVEAKKWIRKISGFSVSNELQKETAHHLAMMRESEEGKEGLNAFLEKRMPRWIK